VSVVFTSDGRPLLGVTTRQLIDNEIAVSAASLSRYELIDVVGDLLAERRFSAPLPKSFGRSASRNCRVSVKWPTSVHCRNVMRRNYRWMRAGGVEPIVARLVLDSTARLGLSDQDTRFARVEAAGGVS
jgi:hypothetical protein